MWLKIKVVVVMVSFLLSTGCVTTLSEIREKKPSRTLTSTKSPHELAKCIEQKIRAGKIGANCVVALEEHPNNTYRIAITQYRSNTVSDIFVKPTDSGSVVECRNNYLWAVDSQLELEAIDRCLK